MASWFILEFEANWAPVGPVLPPTPSVAPVVMQTISKTYGDAPTDRQFSQHGRGRYSDYDRAGPYIRYR